MGVLNLDLTLYHYWRSTSSWRVRWALELKGIPYKPIPVNLLENASESSEHLQRNPAGQVPTLEIQLFGKPQQLSESVAIIEWLEETHPSPALLPRDPFLKARCRQLTEIINSGTQPLQNLGVAQFCTDDPNQQKLWNQHWIRKGLTAYNELVQQTQGQYSIGDQLTMADLFLIPQCYNSLRFEVPLEEFPRVKAIYDHASTLPSYLKAHPDQFAPKS
jgi:maleylpyruvate isomerase